VVEVLADQVILGHPHRAGGLFQQGQHARFARGAHADQRPAGIFVLAGGLGEQPDSQVLAGLGHRVDGGLAELVFLAQQPAQDLNRLIRAQDSQRLDGGGPGRNVPTS
jgi:hypothetical protein